MSDNFISSISSDLLEKAGSFLGTRAADFAFKRYTDKTGSWKQTSEKVSKAADIVTRPGVRGAIQKGLSVASNAVSDIGGVAIDKIANTIIPDADLENIAGQIAAKSMGVGGLIDLSDFGFSPDVEGFSLDVEGLSDKGARFAETVIGNESLQKGFLEGFERQGDKHWVQAKSDLKATGSNVWKGGKAVFKNYFGGSRSTTSSSSLPEHERKLNDELGHLFHSAEGAPKAQPGSKGFFKERAMRNDLRLAMQPSEGGADMGRNRGAAYRSASPVSDRMPLLSAPSIEESAVGAGFQRSALIQGKAGMFSSSLPRANAAYSRLGAGGDVPLVSLDRIAGISGANLPNTHDLEGDLLDYTVVDSPGTTSSSSVSPPPTSPAVGDLRALHGSVSASTPDLGSTTVSTARAISESSSPLTPGMSLLIETNDLAARMAAASPASPLLLPIETPEPNTWNEGDSLHRPIASRGKKYIKMSGTSSSSSSSSASTLFNPNESVHRPATPVGFESSSTQPSLSQRIRGFFSSSSTGISSSQDSHIGSMSSSNPAFAGVKGGAKGSFTLGPKAQMAGLGIMQVVGLIQGALGMVNQNQAQENALEMQAWQNNESKLMQGRQMSQAQDQEQQSFANMMINARQRYRW